MSIIKSKFFKQSMFIVFFVISIFDISIAKTDYKINKNEILNSEEKYHEENDQILQDSSVFEGHIIDEIRLEYYGVKTVTDPFVLAHIPFKKDSKYRIYSVDDSIKSLYSTGLFDNISVFIEKKSENSIVLIYKLNVRSIIKAILFSGNKAYKQSSLEKEITVKVGDPLDLFKLKESKFKIMDFYKKKGYSDAIADYTFDNDTNGISSVTFDIREGIKSSVSSIEIFGNKSIKSSEILDVMKIKKWHIFSWMTGRGKYNSEILAEDINRIKKVYQNNGFLDIHVFEPEISRYKNGMTIKITVEEGIKYFVGKITLKNQTLFSEDELKKLLTIKEKSVFSKEKLDNSCEIIHDFYGQKGYLDSFAIPKYIFNVSNPTVDIILDIKEGQKCYINSIKIEGNTITKSNVILREISLEPGDILNTVRMRNAQSRLQNSKLFSEVIISPEATKIPNKKNLKVQLKEGKTGSCTFGGGYTSVDKFTTFIEWGQGNFDYKNSKTWFRGAGQKFRVRLGLGSKSNEIVVSFEEPWICDRELAWGFEVFRNTAKYVSEYYNQRVIGFETYLRKRLFGLVEGRLSYRLEEINIYDMQFSKVPAIISNEAGKRSVSKVKFALNRDTTNSSAFPTNGSLAEFNVQVAGGPFLGQTNYISSELAAGRWFPTFDTCEQVFSIVGRAASIKGFGGKDVRISDRFFLGGAYNLRGFDFNQVSPKSSDGKSIGGRTFAYSILEYSAMIFNPVRFAVFYDVGFVNSDSLDFSAKNYNSNWGFGVRILVLGAPLRLDLGFPLKSSSKNKGANLQLAFGCVF